MKLAMVVAIALVGCAREGAVSESLGVVAYAERGTSRIMIVDVATNEPTLVDGGGFGLVSISPDRQHVAYGTRWEIKIADRAGRIRPLQIGGDSCYSQPTWGPNSSLQFCFAQNGFGSGSVFVPDPAGAPRRLSSAPPAVSTDGTQIAYLARDQQLADPPGELVLENADGSNRRTLATDTRISPILFLPDGQLLLDDGGRLVRRTRDGAFVDLGVGRIAGIDRPGLSPWSMDQRSILVASAGELVILDLATGAREPIRAIAPGDQAQAGFLADGRVLVVYTEDRSESDIGRRFESVRLLDGAERVLAESTNPNSPCRPAAIDGVIDRLAIECNGQATLVDFDGTAFAAIPTFEVLGLTTDGNGLLSVAADGTITHLSIGGTTRVLGTARSWFDSDRPTDGPFVSYAP